MKRTKILTIYDLCHIAIFTAIIAVMAQLTIPIPLVPLTMQTFAIPLTGAVLGAKKGAIAAIVYLLLGAVGAPVFAGFTGGVGWFVSTTAGFLWSFPLFALIVGIAADKGGRIRLAVGLIIGAAVTMAMGMVGVSLVAGIDMHAAFRSAVYPFIIPELIKLALVFLLAPKVRDAIGKVR